MPSNAFGGENFWWAGARARGESLACILGARSGPQPSGERSGPQRNERKEPAPRWWG
ncbi:unnamed protein product, partial [Heterotrigona itama]